MANQNFPELIVAVALGVGVSSKLTAMGPLQLTRNVKICLLPRAGIHSDLS